MELLNRLQGIRKVGQRFPGVFSFAITFPMDEVFEGTTKHLGVPNVVHLVLFFAVYGDGVGWWGCEAINIIAAVGAQAIDMKDIMQA